MLDALTALKVRFYGLLELASLRAAGALLTLATAFTRKRLGALPPPAPAASRFPWHDLEGRN